MQFSKLLIIDLEATCWDTGTEPPGWTPEKNQEIIEIGACLINVQQSSILASEGFLIKPTTAISDFCTKLTTLTIEDFSRPHRGRDCPPSFDLGLQDLHKWAKSFKFDIFSMPWGSWGDYDRTQIQRECTRKGLNFPLSRTHVNLKAMHALLYGLVGKGMPMSAALKHLGLPLKGTHHRGVDDAVNIGEIFLHLVRKFRIGQL